MSTTATHPHPTVATLCGVPFLIGDLYDTGDAYVLPLTPCCEADVTFIDPSTSATGPIPEILVCRGCKQPAEHKLNAVPHKMWDGVNSLYFYLAQFIDCPAGSDCVFDLMYWIEAALEHRGMVPPTSA